MAFAIHTAVRSIGASKRPSSPPWSRSIANSRPTAITEASKQRHPDDARGEVAVERVAPETEVEEDEDRDGEERHRGHRLAHAQLDQEVLAQDRQRGAEHQPYSSRTWSRVALPAKR